MKVRVTAAGLLEEYLPADSDGEMDVEIPGAPSAPTLRTVMREAGIPENAAPLISLKRRRRAAQPARHPHRLRWGRRALHAEPEGGVKRRGGERGRHRRGACRGRPEVPIERLGFHHPAPAETGLMRADAFKRAGYCRAAGLGGRSLKSARCE